MNLLISSNQSLEPLQPTLALLAEGQAQKQINRALIAAHDLERNTLGLALRDNVSQLLSSAQLLLQAAREETPDASTNVQNTCDHIAAAIDEICRVSKSLCFSSIEDVGLKGALEDLINDLKVIRPVTAWLDYDDTMEDLLTDEQKRTIYRIVEQQMENIAQHADANHIVVAVLQEGNCFALLIGDDGKGVDINNNMVNGTGLLNTYCRVNALNGSMNIESAPGKGFHLDIKIPLAG